MYDKSLNYDSDDHYYLICGDMNAHTKEFDDYAEHICKQLNINAEIIVRLQVKDTMYILNICIHSQRKFVDKCKDIGKYGKALLELCKNIMEYAFIMDG